MYSAVTYVMALHNKIAKENFNKFTQSQKNQYLYWIMTAKMPETRANRVKQVVLRSEQNKKLGLV